MATFIKVTQEGSELLRRNVEQTQANRLAKLEGDEQRRTEQQAREARQQALQQQGLNANGDVQGGGRRRGQFRRDEPAATFLPQPTGIAQVWYEYFTGATGLPVWRVYCADGSSSVMGSRDSSAGSSWLFLPVGGPNGIFVVLSRTNPGLSIEGVYGVPLNRAYICGLSKVRQINIPPTLAGVLDILNPPAGPGVDQDSFIPEGVNTSPLPPRQLQLSITGSYDATTGWADPSFAAEWSPRVYELLHIIKPYAGEAAFKRYSQNYPITYDYTGGLTNSLLSLDKSWYYAKWLGNPFNVSSTNPELLQRLPALRVKLNTWPPANADFPYSIDNNGNPQIAANHIVAWDWDDPAYCLQMLSLLGFSASDLKP